MLDLLMNIVIFVLGLTLGIVDIFLVIYGVKYKLDKEYMWNTIHNIIISCLIVLPISSITIFLSGNLIKDNLYLNKDKIECEQIIKQNLNNLNLSRNIHQMSLIRNQITSDYVSGVKSYQNFMLFLSETKNGKSCNNHYLSNLELGDFAIKEYNLIKSK